MRLAALLLGIFLLVAVATYLLHRFFGRKKFIKYLPAFLLMLLGIYNLYLARTVYTGFEDIARAILVVMFLTGSFSGAITAVFLDYLYPRFRK